MDYKDYINKNNIEINKQDIVFELSNLITEARLYAGLTQAKLAEKMGKQQPSIARAERGETSPSIEFLQKIAEAIGAKLVLPRFDFMEESRATAATNFDSNTISQPSPIMYFISNSSPESRATAQAIL